MSRASIINGHKDPVTVLMHLLPINAARHVPAAPVQLSAIASWQHLVQQQGIAPKGSLALPAVTVFHHVF